MFNRMKRFYDAGSEQSTGTGGNNTQTDKTKETIDVQSLQEKLVALERQNQELKGYKDDMLKFKAEKQKSEEQALMTEKKWEELAQKRQKEIEEANEKISKLSNSLVQTEVDRIVVEEAQKYGLDPNAKDVLLSLQRTGVVPSVVATQTGGIQVTAQGVKEFVAAIAASKPFLFGKKSVKVNDLPANSGALPGDSSSSSLDGKEIYRLVNSKDATEQAKGKELLSKAFANLKP